MLDSDLFSHGGDLLSAAFGWYVTAARALLSLIWIASLLPALKDVPSRELVGSLAMQNEAVEEARGIGG